ncbi:MAG TPA: MBL fold metallo-hydrolase [Steroidobacteraceae bacterium]|jgi:glyoxylase-like metal-dependent hydrolase (beta-lactamase superfamily II)|nr:MBL fold metallo-hydrolase [Steroidobacteraceae bacterium]
MYMLTVNGINVAVQTGPDGTIVVDPGPQSDADAVLAAISKVTNNATIRTVIYTNSDADLVGGGGVLSSAGLNLGSLDNFISGQDKQIAAAGTVSLPGANAGEGATIIARQALQLQMLSQNNYASSALPTETFQRRQYNFNMNDGPIEVISMPAAHSDADSVVRFDRQDVVVTGAVFDETHFPVIDLAHGGSIQGEIDALNQVVNTLSFQQIPVLANTGGTLIIPMRGPLCDADDLAIYRDMVMNMRARVAYYLAQGKSLKQVEAEHPAQGYESRFGSDTGNWTSSDFVEAIYKSLVMEKSAQHGKVKS